MGKSTLGRMQNILAVERHIKALELRKAGHSYSSIANQLEYATAQSAYMAVQAALKRLIAEPGEEVLRLELGRLDDLLIPLIPLAQTGDQGAIDRILKIMERRSKYLGLDAPTKIAPTDPSGNNPYLHMSDEELVNAVSAIIAGTTDGNRDPAPAEQTELAPKSET